MSNYLFRIQSFGNDSKDIFDTLIKKYNYEVTAFIPGSSVNASVTISTGCATFYISEFPGNCSALVLHHIQTHWAYPIKDEIMKFAIELCEKFDYACLFITTTDMDMVKDLINDYGFVVTSSFVNEHSGSRNYFLQKFVLNSSTADVIPAQENL
jgi:hypothetical protein